MTLFTLSFYILGGLAVLGSLSMLLSKHPMRCAVSLLFVMLILAFMYALLSAPFMAILQLIIYAGAVMTLIVFIVTLVDVKGDDLTKVFSRLALIAVPLVTVLLVIAIQVAHLATPANTKLVGEFGTVQTISQQLLSQYLLHFEVASLLLLVGVIGISALRGKKDQQ